MLPILAVIVAVLIVVGVLIFFMYKRRKEFDYKPGIKAGLITYLIIFVAHIIFLNIGVLGTTVIVNYPYIFLTTFPVEIIKGIFWGAIFVFFLQ